MTTLAARGSGTPATTGTTWASVTNAVDGAAGTNPATYATATNAVASAVQTIEITGYGFSTSIGATDTLNSVTVSLRHFENNTGRFASVRFQAFDGATAIGTATTCTLATAARNDTATVAATLAQLRSSTFKIVVTITGAASTQSRIESIDYVDVTADYTPTPPAITQAAYRFYADGTETASTALANQDTGYTADTSTGDVNLQVRTRLQSTTAVAVPATDDWQLQWEKNTSGTWTDIGGNVLADSQAGVDVAVAFGIATTGFARLGQSFLGNGSKLMRVGFWIASLGNPTYNVSAELYAHTGTFGTSGVGTGSPLTATAQRAANTVSDIAGWVYFDFDGSFTLASGTPYVVTLTADVRSGDGANRLLVSRTGNTSSHAGAEVYFTTVWGTESYDLAFRLYTSGAVLPYASANLTDGAATTNRLGAGSGSFVAGKVSETGLVTDLGWAANNYTEVLYSVTLKQADLAPTNTLRFRVLRNGATTGLTYTQVPTITIGAGGPVARTGVATGSLTLSGIAAGVPGVTGTATGTLTVVGVAAGAPSTPGVSVTGTATGSLTVAGVAAGVPGVVGAATGAVAVAGVAAGIPGVRGVATGSLTVAGVAAGIPTVTATATGTLTLSGTAVGVPGVRGVATGTLTLAGTASGQKTATATATGTLAVAGAASGVRDATATATGALTLTGTASATKTVTGTATGQIAITSQALGLVEGNAVGVGTGQLTVVGLAVGHRGTTATATGTIAITGLATGQHTVTATVTGTIIIAGTADGVAVGVAVHTVNVWNGTAFVDAPVRTWNGTAWVDAEAVKTWNGSTFVDAI